MAEFVEQYDMASIDHVADEAGLAWLRFQVGSQPSYVFINDDGAMYRHSGRLESGPLSDALTRLIED